MFTDLFLALVSERESMDVYYVICYESKNDSVRQWFSGWRVTKFGDGVRRPIIVPEWTNRPLVISAEDVKSVADDLKTNGYPNIRTLQLCTM